MAPSRVVLALGAALAVSALACDALLGLGAYQEVDGDAAAESGAGSFDGSEDASDTSMTANPDASDASVAPDADASDALPNFDGSVDGLPLTELWAQWTMPNPDASAAPTLDGSPTLPNPMEYDAGADGGAATALDLQTGLTWTRNEGPQVGTFAQAVGYCASQGSGWHVPTRIQLVSLIDFTQPSGSATIDPNTFPSAQAQFHWTESQVPVDAAAPLYWVVDFGTGLVTQRGAGSYYVRCVKDSP